MSHSSALANKVRAKQQRWNDLSSCFFIFWQGEKGEMSSSGVGIKGEPGVPGLSGPKVLHLQHGVSASSLTNHCSQLLTSVIYYIIG